MAVETITNRLKLLTVPGIVQEGAIRSSIGPNLGFERDSTAQETDKNGEQKAVGLHVPIIDFKNGVWLGLRTGIDGHQPYITSGGQVYQVQDGEGGFEDYAVSFAGGRARVPKFALESIWNETAMSILVGFRLSAGEASSRAVFEMRAGAGDMARLAYRADDGGRLEFVWDVGGVLHTLDLGAVGENQSILALFTMEANGRLKGFLSGSKVFDQEIGSLPTADDLRLGYSDDLEPMEGYFRAVGIFDSVIPEDEALSVV